jgi:hypothetical protein
MRVFRVVILIALSLSMTCQVKQDTVKRFTYHSAYKHILTIIEMNTPHRKRWKKLGRLGREKIAHRYAEVSTNVCEIYGLDLETWIRHGDIESEHRFWVESPVGAVGWKQVDPYWHSGRLYYIQNCELGAYLLKRRREGKKVDHKKYLKRIGYNGHVSASLWRDWLDKYNSYPVMLAAYMAGPDSDYRKELQTNINALYKTNHTLYEDIRYILNEKR